jgi:regulator of sigma E protease
LSFLLAFVGFAVLIILHELGHFAAAKAVGMRVERFSLFFPPLLARVRRGETEYAIGAVPLGGYVKITGMNPNEPIAPEHAHRAYYRQAVWKRIVVISAGPAVNIVLAFLILLVLFWANGAPEQSRTVEAVERGWPAAGQLEPGDRILAVDGEEGDQAAIAQRIASHECAGTPTPRCRATTDAVLLVERGGRPLSVRLTPEYDPEVQRTRIGYRFEPAVFRPIGPIEAAGESVSEMWFFTSRTVSTIAQLFKPEVRDDISGVVGSYEVTRQTIEVDLERAVLLLAIISLSLGVINLFPFLPLDGGHIFWALAEKVRGRAIPFSVMERAGFVGFVLVIGLFLIGFTNDIDRLTGEGFGVR